MLSRSLRPRAGLLLSLALLWAALVSCGGGAGPADAANGEQLFNGRGALASSDAPTCISCHPVGVGEPGNIGNNLSNIGNRAATTVPDQTPEDYLRAAILEPDAYLAGGFQEGIHYRGYDQVLNDQQVNDLIAYMLTLKSGQD